MSCCICYENLKDTKRIITECNHTFHIECLNSWLNEKNNCPLCRQIIYIGEINFKDFSEDNWFIFVYSLQYTKMDNCLIFINKINEDNGMNALQWAIKHNLIELVEYLVSKGADVYSVDIFNRNVLMLCFEHCKGMLDFFLNLNVDINSCDRFGYDFVYYVVNDPIYLQIAINLGAKLSNTYDCRKYSLLHLVDNKDSFNILVKYIDVNVVDVLGNSILHTAVYNNRHHLHEIMIDNGVYVNTKNNNGHTYKCICINSQENNFF